MTLLLRSGTRQRLGHDRRTFDREWCLRDLGRLPGCRCGFDDGLCRIQLLPRCDESYRLMRRPCDDDGLVRPVAVGRSMNGPVSGSMAVNGHVAVSWGLVDWSLIVDWRMVARRAVDGGVMTDRVTMDMSMMTAVAVAEAVVAVAAMTLVTGNVVAMAVALRAVARLGDARCSGKSEDSGDGEERFHGGNPFWVRMERRLVLPVPVLSTGQPFMTQVINAVQSRVNRELSVSV